MAQIMSAPGARSTEGDAKAAGWRGLLDELNARRRAAVDGGSAKARQRHVARGKLLARERVACLLDPASRFSKSAASPPSACMKAMCTAPAW